MSITSVNDLILHVLNSQPDEETKIRLIDEIRKARPPLEDRWLYRIAVWALTVTVVITVISGVGVFAYMQKGVPDGIIAIGSAAIGALAALITPRHHADNDR